MIVARHIKRDSEYAVVTQTAKLQTTKPLVEGDVVAVYQGLETGAWWARDIREFRDGRFKLEGRPDLEDPIVAHLRQKIAELEAQVSVLTGAR